MGAFVQSASTGLNGNASNPNTFTITMGSLPTVGNTIYVSTIGFTGGSTISYSVTDNQTPANTYTKDIEGQAPGSSGHGVGLFSCPVVTSSGSFVITVSCTNPSTVAQYLVGIAGEFSGIPTAPVNRSATGLPTSQVSTLDTTATATTTVPDTLLLAVGEGDVALINQQSGTTPSSGWSSIIHSGAPRRVNMEYQFVSSTVAARHVWNITNTQYTCACVAAYETAGSNSKFAGKFGGKLAGKLS